MGKSCREVQAKLASALVLLGLIPGLATATQTESEGAKKKAVDTNATTQKVARVEMTGTRMSALMSGNYQSVTFVNKGFNSGSSRSETGGGVARGTAPAQSNQADAASDQNTSVKNECPSSSPSTGQPVVIATGEKHKTEVDIVAAGLHALPLDRTYRSIDPGWVSFGSNWRSQYDWNPLHKTGCYNHADYPGVCMPTAVTMTLPDGGKYIYKPTNPGDQVFLRYRVSGADAQGLLQYYPADAGNPVSYWVLVRNKTTYVFNAQGRITSIARVGVFSHTYAYTAQNQVASVTNAAGQKIEFTYTAGRVTQVKDTGGKFWSYAYDAYGMLTTVTSPGPSPDVRTYHYEDAVNRSLLTGISINGTRYSTYKYYANRKVQESGLAGGEEKDTFVYGTNQTTVTSALGQPTVYSFTPVQGALKLSGVSRSATSTCAAAAAQTVYDANGWVDYTLDWNNNKTDYSYDAAGKLLSATQAAGTADAGTRVNTWSGSDVAGTTYKDTAGATYASVAYTYYASGMSVGRLASET
jgi:YD repeat-containing protein